MHPRDSKLSAELLLSCPGVREGSATHKLQPVSTETPRTEQEQGAEFAAHRSACNQMQISRNEAKISLRRTGKHAEQALSAPLSLGVPTTASRPRGIKP